MFGMVDAGAVFNGCSAEVRRYSSAAGLYELVLPNGSRPIVPKEHVQPNVEDPVDAQTALELAIGQQEVRLGYHLGLRTGTLALAAEEISGGVRSDCSTFGRIAQVEFYDAALAQYGIRWEEPPQWSCERCTLLNDADIGRCAACAAAAPGGASSRLCVAANQLQPLVSNIDDVKSIVQLHWKRQADDIYESVTSFDDLRLEEALVRGIRNHGLEKPTEVQQRTIRPMLHGQDLIVQAGNGSGASTALAIGVLGHIRPHLTCCQAIVLTATRELAQQFHKTALELGAYLQITLAVVFGGGGIRDQIDSVRAGPHVVIGTSGRVYDMISKRHLRVDDVQCCVLDQADEMLSRGYQDQIHDIVKALPPNVQVCVSSASMFSGTTHLATKLMHNAVRIAVKTEELSLDGIRHFYVAIEKAEWKADTICDLFECVDFRKAIVYCNTRRKVDYVVDFMAKQTSWQERSAATISTMHADLDQRERDAILREFHSATAPVILVSTDILPRHGQEDLDLSFVLNFDLPQNMDNYLHRVGQRTGFRRRYANRGVALNFVMNEDVRLMKDIERYYHVQMEEMPMDIADLI
jgi:translation initiation factor 4A